MPEIPYKHREHTVSAETACKLPPGDTTDWQVSAYNSSWSQRLGAQICTHTPGAHRLCRNSVLTTTGRHRRLASQRASSSWPQRHRRTKGQTSKQLEAQHRTPPVTLSENNSKHGWHPATHKASLGHKEQTNWGGQRRPARPGALSTSNPAASPRPRCYCKLHLEAQCRTHPVILSENHLNQGLIHRKP